MSKIHIDIGQVCSVSQELVDLVINTFPYRFRNSKGEVELDKLLYCLGFNINLKSKNGGYYKIPNVFIRDNRNPRKVYKTKNLYNGTVRPCHPLTYLYKMYEVVQPNNLKRLVPEEEFKDIVDIGDPIVYDKAFLIKCEK